MNGTYCATSTCMNRLSVYEMERFNGYCGYCHERKQINHPRYSVVRKIDDLGRVVINEEIRHHMRIKEGDPLAMWVDGHRLIVEKFSNLTPHASEVESLAELVSRRTKSVCMITSRSHVIAVAGNDAIKRRAVGARVSEYVAHAMWVIEPLHLFFPKLYKERHSFKPYEELVLYEGGHTVVEEIYIHPIAIKDREAAAGAVIIFRGVPNPGEKYARAQAYDVPDLTYDVPDLTAVELAAELLLSKMTGDA